MMKKIILASKSPRRKELLEMVGIRVEIDVEETVEEVDNDIPITAAIEKIALQKAQAVAKRHHDEVILAADTIVLLENEILGKPKDEEDAFGMLLAMRNKKHEVITAVCIMFKGSYELFSSKTEVKMRDYSPEIIDAYIATKEPLDKAGAYGIQGKGAILVESINGDYYTVMGLPLAEVYQRLRKYL